MNGPRRRGGGAGSAPRTRGCRRAAARSSRSGSPLVWRACGYPAAPARDGSCRVRLGCWRFRGRRVVPPGPDLGRLDHFHPGSGPVTPMLTVLRSQLSARPRHSPRTAARRTARSRPAVAAGRDPGPTHSRPRHHGLPGHPNCTTCSARPSPKPSSPTPSGRRWSPPSPPPAGRPAICSPQPPNTCDIAETEHLRPDEYARLLTYRVELLTHHAATIDVRRLSDGRAGELYAAEDPAHPRTWMELLFLRFTTLSSRDCQANGVTRCRTTGPASSPYTSRTALLTKRRAVRSTNTWLPGVHDGAVKCGLGVRRHFPGLTQAHRAVPS